MRMKRPPPSPYSRMEQIRENRAELVALVLAGVLLGILLSVLSNAVYDYLVTILQTRLYQWLAFILGLVLSLLFVILVVVLFHSRGESQVVHLEVAIPYHLPGNDGIEVAMQHRYRPTYEAARHARALFSGAYPHSSEANRTLRSGWEQAKAENPLFQRYMLEANDELVEALIVMVLHRYGEDSLGPSARYGFWHVEMDTAEYAPADLPPQLAANRYLEAMLSSNPGWKLLLPRRMDWHIYETEGRQWSLKHRWFGSLNITCHCPPWVAKRRSQPGRVLGEGIQRTSQDEFYVLGTRLQAVAVSSLTFLRQTDAFHEWASGFLAYLEEALDWTYFLQSRPLRMIVDIPWKLGDLPLGRSLWDKLEAIEKQLQEIEKQLPKPPA